MYKLIKSTDRGRTQWAWLDSYHSFSFGDYLNPNCINFRSLRVINEDYISPNSGFDLHPHENMEIITIVLEGVLEHQDTLGNKTQIKRGEIQRMSAGTGIEHSEYNASKSEELHLLQIWLLPNLKDIPPSYEQKDFLNLLKSKSCNLIISSIPREQSLSINQDIDLFWLQLKSNEKKTILIEKKRHLWIQMIKGKAQINECTLLTGDGLGISQEDLAQITANDDSELIIFDLS